MELPEVPSSSEIPFTPHKMEPTNRHSDISRVDKPDEPLSPVEETSIEPKVPDTPPVREEPVAGSADRPSLQKALFTYALPVVCAWFGSIVTDLF